MTMVKFSEETETLLYFANEEKRDFSVAMSPDKLIYRNNIQANLLTYSTQQKRLRNFNKTTLERTLTVQI
jgi:hypothetical protein